MDRISWNEYFFQITHLVAERSTCIRRKVGAVIVKENRILSSGYNGAVKGLVHCREVGCIREKQKIPSGERHELCRGVHAEQNAIIQAASFGVSVKDSVIYCTNMPCSICIKMIINAGIYEIRYDQFYNDRLSQELIEQAGITIKRRENEEKDTEV